MAVPERWEGVTVEEMIEHFTEKEAEVERLRAAIEEHKDGNTHMSLTNLKLWDVLDNVDRGF